MIRTCLLVLWMLAAPGAARAAEASGAGASAGAAPVLASASAHHAPAHEALLVVANRNVFAFRATFGGVPPDARAMRASKRIEELDVADGVPPIDVVVFDQDGRRAVALRARGTVLFAVTEGDLEPGADTDVRQAAGRSRQALVDALEVMREQRRWPTIARGVAVTIGASGALALALHLLMRAVGALRARVARWSVASRRAVATAAAGAADARVAGGAPGSDADATASPAPARWAGYGGALLERLLQLAMVLFAGLLVFLWIEVVLYAFPTTVPVGRRLLGAFADSAWQILDGIATALPGLLVAGFILLIARGLVEASDAVFRGVRERRLQVPGLVPETAEATRKLVLITIWAFALVAVYPYLPGSGSEVFKGVSVLIGAMITLGSTGIANQLMSGLVLVYSRALRRGDYVVVGDTEGVVAEVGTLATKVRTMRNEEVTIPNAVLVANPIRNYSKHAGESGTMISTRVTIGYDAPWRQVHALLLAAAARTTGLRAEPAPYVVQRALSDFYVEYELFVFVDRPLERVPMLSALHAQIQDAFNEAGVQIMSPHFLAQPDAAVVVPKSRWNPAAAAPAPE